MGDWGTPFTHSTNKSVHTLAPSVCTRRLVTGLLNETESVCVCVCVCAHTCQTILPAHSRTLISVAGSVICTAGGSWHFLSQRQHARTLTFNHQCMHIGHSQPCTPSCEHWAFPETHKSTAEMPTMVTPTGSIHCPRIHTLVHTGTHTRQLMYAQNRCTQETCPQSSWTPAQTL